jgi:hypothetical protein
VSRHRKRRPEKVEFDADCSCGERHRQVGSQSATPGLVVWQENTLGVRSDLSEMTGSRSWSGRQAYFLDSVIHRIGSGPPMSSQDWAAAKLLAKLLGMVEEPGEAGLGHMWFADPESAMQRADELGHTRDWTQP